MLSIFFCTKLFTYLPWDHCRAERLLRMSPQFDRIPLPAVKMKFESLIRRTKTKLATDKSKLVVAQCKGFRNWGIQNPGNFVRWIRNPRLWNPEYSSSNVTPTPTKDWNPCSANKAPEASTLNPKSNVWNPESKTTLDPFHWAVVALWACYCKHV